MKKKVDTKWKRILISAIIFMIVAQAIHGTGVILEIDYYLDENYYPVWSSVMMPSIGAPPLDFFYYSILFNVLGGIFFVLVYSMVKGSLEGGYERKGIIYGIMIFLVAGVPSTLSLLLLINLPAMLISLWAIENLVIYIFGGIITAKIVK
jgi:hypothetical protein